MKELIISIIKRYKNLNPSLSDEDFVEMLSSEIADEVKIKLDDELENEKLQEKEWGGVVIYSLFS